MKENIADSKVFKAMLAALEAVENNETNGLIDLPEDTGILLDDALSAARAMFGDILQ